VEGYWFVMGDRRIRGERAMERWVDGVDMSRFLEERKSRKKFCLPWIFALVAAASALEIDFFL
jgi:hypothetical protein